MAEHPSWGQASDEDADARDMEMLVQQPECTDDYIRVHIHVPELFKQPSKLHRLKKELSRDFNINKIVCPKDRNMDNVICVEGYGLDPNDILITIRCHDSRATIQH